MAIADKNILITPNISGILGNQPNVVFTGADSSIGDSAAITVTARPENSGTLSFTGTAGQLFSITNSLEGTIFAVNDVSGIPSLEIDDAGVIKMAEFNGRILLGGATDDSTNLLQVNGHIQLSGYDGTGSVGALKFGDDSGLQIYKVASNNNSVIQNSHATGDLLFLSHLHSFRNAGNTEVMANFIENGAVELNFNNNKSFETRNLGFMYEDSNVVVDIGNQSNFGSIEVGGSAGAFIDFKAPKSDDYDFRLITTGSTGVIHSDDFHIQSKTAENYLDATINGAVNLYYDNVKKFETTEGGVTVTGTMNADSSTITGKINAGVLEGRGGVTYDPPGTSGSETSTSVGLALHSGDRIVLGHDGYIRTIVDATASSPLKFGQSGTGYFAGTEVYGGSQGVKLKYSTTTRFETLDSGVNVTGNLRVNNAELASGASAGFAIAMAIAL